MKSAASSFAFAVALTVVSLGGGAAWFSQRQQGIRLQAERDALRSQQEDVARLQADNQRLKSRQIPATELAALRADHATLLRLRAELDALKRP